MRSLSRYTCGLKNQSAASLWLVFIMAMGASAQTLPLNPGASQGSALSAPLGSTERPRVALLRNDRCLTGIIRQLGDSVVIEIASDARISKPASEVVFIADDMQGIYQYKLSRYPRLGPGENIRLARWTLANGLHEQASRHFLAVHREAGENPLVKQLGIELREQLLKDTEFRQYLGLPPIVTPSAAATQNVRTVSTDGEPAVTPIIPAVLTSFADHLQPILLKRCSQSGCHGLNATNKLKFVQPLGSARARISEQNCRAVLKFVEVDDSGVSVLMKYALAAHGLQKTPAIPAQDSKLVEVLQSWTTFARNPVMAAVDQAPVLPAGSAARNVASPAVYTAEVRGSSNAANLKGPQALSPLSPGAMQLPVQPAVTPASSTSPGSLSTPGPSKRELDELDDQVRRALGEPPRSPSADPFDPAEFNRRRAAGKQ
ncbi:MAG: hypothetical protein IT423_04830 [Pirellulaceae bacterium]|nr:hypothetical protein [Pirellulaceae bacterium]